MKKLLIAGNWKMNMTASESMLLFKSINDSLPKNLCEGNVEVLVCPPFTSLYPLGKQIETSDIKLGAQNCHYENAGAFTGEISVPMLKGLACSFVITGHSERRQKFFETDTLINKKLKSLLAANVTPILCIGETLEERNSGLTEKILAEQLNTDFTGIVLNPDSRIVIAYEPIWAIGTGVSATVAQIDETHNFIRKHLSGIYGNIPASQLPILYGGSVNDTNAGEILGIKEVSGALIGGASLKAEKFISIINTATNID